MAKLETQAERLQPWAPGRLVINPLLPFGAGTPPWLPTRPELVDIEWDSRVTLLRAMATSGLSRHIHKGPQNG